MCAPGAPQCCGSGPALLRISSQMMCACWNQDVCFLSTEIANVIASNCGLRKLSRFYIFFMNTHGCLLEFCMNRTLLATG